MAIDWTKIYEEYKGLWVAFMDDEKTVVGSGQTAKEAFEQARNKGCQTPILTHMPSELTAYVGLSQRYAISI